MNDVHVLLVDDEPSLVAVLEPVLKAAGCVVTTSNNGLDALEKAEITDADVMLLDLGLPDIDGKDVIQRVRLRSALPIIVISARHQQEEKIDALDSGADDYVDKPFEIGELMARIRAAVRRRHDDRKPSSRYRAGPLTIDAATRTVTLEGEVVRLAPKEYDLLLTLARSAGQVVTHRKLLVAGWGNVAADAQYLRVYIGLIRQKIEEDPSNPQLLLTEPGVGYRLVSST
jgi:two-component system KDP operon response regulator KdpE